VLVPRLGLVGGGWFYDRNENVGMNYEADGRGGDVCGYDLVHARIPLTTFPTQTSRTRSCV